MEGVSGQGSHQSSRVAGGVGLGRWEFWLLPGTEGDRGTRATALLCWGWSIATRRIQRQLGEAGRVA